MFKRITSLAICAVAFLCLSGAVRAQQDTIAMADGKDRKAKILSEDYDSVKISFEGGTQDLRRKQIASIKYSGAEPYYKAVDAFNAGKVVDSIPLLEALVADTKLRNVLRQGALYHLGLAYAKQGQTDKLIANNEALLTEFPKSRYLIEAGTGLLSAYRAKGNGAGAAKSIEAALAANKAAASDAALEADLNVLRGLVALEQKKFADAERAFSSAAGAAGASPNTIASAKLGSARAAAENNNKTDAEKRFREVVAMEASNNVLAGAWNGLGDLALEQAVSARDRDMSRVALHAYLRAAVLYPPDRSSISTEEHERGISGAARAFEASGQLEGNAERKKLLLSRAKQQRDNLAKQYPGSRFLKP